MGEYIKSEEIKEQGGVWIYFGEGKVIEVATEPYRLERNTQ